MDSRRSWVLGPQIYHQDSSRSPCWRRLPATRIHIRRSQDPEPDQRHWDSSRTSLYCTQLITPRQAARSTCMYIIFAYLIKCLKKKNKRNKKHTQIGKWNDCRRSPVKSKLLDVANLACLSALTVRVVCNLYYFYCARVLIYTNKDLI